MHFEDICLPLAAHIVQNWRGGLICCHVLWNLHLVARLCKVGSSRTLSESPAPSSRKCGVSCVPLALPAKTFSPADWPWLQVCCSAEESGVQVRRSDGHQWAKARPDQNTSYGCIHWWIEQLLQLCAVFHLATAPKQTLLQSMPWGMLTNPPYASFPMEIASLRPNSAILSLSAGNALGVLSVCKTKGTACSKIQIWHQLWHRFPKNWARPGWNSSSVLQLPDATCGKSQSAKMLQACLGNGPKSRKGCGSRRGIVRKQTLAMLAGVTQSVRMERAAVQRSKGGICHRIPALAARHHHQHLQHLHLPSDVFGHSWSCGQGCRFCKAMANHPRLPSKQRGIALRHVGPRCWPWSRAPPALPSTAHPSHRHSSQSMQILEARIPGSGCSRSVPQNLGAFWCRLADHEAAFAGLAEFHAPKGCADSKSGKLSAALSGLHLHEDIAGQPFPRSLLHERHGHRLDDPGVDIEIFPKRPPRLQTVAGHQP